MELRVDVDGLKDIHGQIPREKWVISTAMGYWKVIPLFVRALIVQEGRRKFHTMMADHAQGHLRHWLKNPTRAEVDKIYDLLVDQTARDQFEMSAAAVHG